MESNMESLHTRKRELALLRQDILTHYKNMMHDLAPKYRDIPSEDVRIEIANTIQSHIWEKTKERLHRRIRRKVEKVLIPIDTNQSIDAEEMSW